MHIDILTNPKLMCNVASRTHMLTYGFYKTESNLVESFRCQAIICILLCRKMCIPSHMVGWRCICIKVPRMSLLYSASHNIAIYEIKSYLDVDKRKQKNCLRNIFPLFKNENKSDFIYVYIYIIKRFLLQDL